MKLKPAFLLACLCALATTAFGDVQKTVDDLLPKLAATPVGERYAPQMELQAMTLSAARPGAEKERAALAKVLAARAADAAVPQPARVWLVRQLEYIGAAESVPVLTALLTDSNGELKECARRALEKNSSPAATDSLRAALETGGDAKWRTGLIQSLGERRDAKSVEPIAKALEEPDTAFAAACALAKVGNEPAVKDLWAAFNQKVTVAPDALLDAANRLQAGKDSKRAAAIYARLYTGCESVQRRAAALHGLAKAAPAQARKLIPDALSGSELKLQEAAVSAARQVYGKSVSAALAELVPKLSPSAKVCVFRALDRSAEPQLIAATSEANPEVQLAALETLGRVGTPASVPVLVQTSVNSPGQAGKAALVALGELSCPGVDQAITSAAAQGEPKARRVAINALASRNTRSAVPALLHYAGEADPEVNGAACSALSTLATQADLEALAKLALAGTASGAEAPLEAVVIRAQDKTSAADKLVSLLPGTQPRQTVVLLNALTVCGGKRALVAISQYVSSPNQEVQDAAVHALGSWPDFGATTPLLAVASAPTATRVHNVVAIEGIARLVKGSDQELADTRLDAALAAMKVATRPEDKKLLLSAVASVRSARAAEAIQPFLKDAQLNPEAALAALSLSDSLLKTDKTAAKALAQAVKDANVSAKLSGQAEELLQK